VDTVWVLGDQLNRQIGALGSTRPGEVRVLLVVSRAKATSKRWHRQRLHLVVTAMRRFAAELRRAGYDVDLREADTLAAGLRAHRDEHRPARVVATEPASWDGLAMLRRHEVDVVRSNQFLCHYDEFARWAGGRSQLRMEDFYRWQRVRLGYLMDGDEPAGGRWNFDADNREPPPRDGTVAWPEPRRSRLDGLDPTWWRHCHRRRGARNRSACGRRAAPARSRASATWSAMCCRASARTRTPCSPATGTSPTRC
jgi:deoxyribodipyrimidine photolyase-related protein